MLDYLIKEHFSEKPKEQKKPSISDRITPKVSDYDLNKKADPATIHVVNAIEGIQQEPAYTARASFEDRIKQGENENLSESVLFYLFRKDQNRVGMSDEDKRATSNWLKELRNRIRDEINNLSPDPSIERQDYVNGASTDIIQKIVNYAKDHPDSIIGHVNAHIFGLKMNLNLILGEITPAEEKKHDNDKTVEIKRRNAFLPTYLKDFVEAQQQLKRDFDRINGPKNITKTEEPTEVSIGVQNAEVISQNPPAIPLQRLEPVLRPNSVQ